MIFRLVIVVLAFAMSVLGSVGVAAANALHSGRQIEGLSLLVAFGTLAICVIVWATGVLPQEQVVDQRNDYPSSANARAEAEAALDARSLPLRFWWQAVDLDDQGLPI